MELVNTILCCKKKKNANDDDNDDDAEMNDNAWGQFILTRRHPEQIMSRIRLMRYPRSTSRDDHVLALTVHAYNSPDHDEKRETSV